VTVQNNPNIDIAQKQLDAYNARTWRLMSPFRGRLRGVRPERRADRDLARGHHHPIRQGFRPVPENKAILKGRIAVGNTVVDHELVIRAPGGEQFEIIASTPSRTG
jgi:hypothetical protein